MGQQLILRATLPDYLDNQMVLGFFAGQNATVYIDGKLRYTFDVAGNPYPGELIKRLFLTFPVSAEDCGKEIVIDRSTSDPGKTDMQTIYYGTQLGMIKRMAKSQGILIIMAIVLITVAVGCILISLAARFVYKQSGNLVWLGLAVLVSALWVICDSELYPFLFNNYYVDGLTGYMLIMMTPYPFIRYLDLEQKHRHKLIHTILYGVILTYTVVFTVLHFADIASFDTTRGVMNVLYVMALMTLLGTVVYEQIKGYAKHYKILSVGIGGLILCGSVEIILINAVEDRADGIWFLVGLMFLMLTGMAQAVMDITESERKTREAVEASRMKSDFLASMSHELRTPINAVLGLNELTLRESTEENIREYAEDIQIAGRNLLAIINDILDISKIEEGRLDIVPGAYYTAELIGEVDTVIRIKAEQKGLQFEVKADEKLPCELYGDMQRIRQVIINLLNNAVKYTREGQVTLEVSGEHIEGGLCLRIRVTDTGIGIREEDKDRLFRKFERLDTTVNRNVEGTGLGLAITANLVSLMGGTIDAESEYGSGSTFIVEIPQKILNERRMGNYRLKAANDTKEQEVSHQAFTAPDARILVVDDNRMNRFVFSRLLGRTQIRVDQCESGFEALKKMAEESYDVIFMDHMMPEMDGIETLRRAGEMPDNKCRNTPVIALTANAINGMREMYLETGFDDYLSKPVDSRLLEQILYKYIPKEKIRE